MTESAADILAALARLAGHKDPWRVDQGPECTACEGTGSLQTGTFRGWTWIECWDCNGTGTDPNANPTVEKDISHDE